MPGHPGAAVHDALPGGALTRESAAATSHVAYAALDDAGIAAAAGEGARRTGVPRLTEGGVSLDALGGAVADRARRRDRVRAPAAMMTVQYTAAFPDGADPAPLDSYVHDFRSAMVPSWGYGAYVNYADASITDWADAYFAGNAARLARIRRQYDPQRLFPSRSSPAQHPKPLSVRTAQCSNRMSARLTAELDPGARAAATG